MSAVDAKQQQYGGALQADLQLVRRELSGAFGGLSECEQLPLRQSFSSPGKMLRPALVLAASHYTTNPAPERIAVAAAAELIHIASLIHDDVIDCAQSRRGRPSLNASWGEGVAILTGDVYFTGALSRLSQLGDSRLTGIFVDCVAEMCRSELRQTLARFDPNQTEDTYLAAISGKTASLFAASSRAGGVLARLQAADQEILARFGWSMGMAFQLADDIADLAAGASKEPAGQDIRGGIWTLPVIHCLKSQAGNSLYRLIASERAHEDLPAIYNTLRDSGSMDYAIARARAFCRQAYDALTSLPEAAPRAILHDVVDGIETALERSRVAICG